MLTSLALDKKGEHTKKVSQGGTKVNNVIFGGISCHRILRVETTLILLSLLHSGELLALMVALNMNSDDLHLKVDIFQLLRPCSQPRHLVMTNNAYYFDNAIVCTLNLNPNVPFIIQPLLSC